MLPKGTSPDLCPCPVLSRVIIKSIMGFLWNTYKQNCSVAFFPLKQPSPCGPSVVAWVGQGSADNPWRNVQSPQGCRWLQSLYHVVFPKTPRWPIAGQLPSGRVTGLGSSPCSWEWANRAGSSDSCHLLFSIQKNGLRSHTVFLAQSKHSFLAAINADCIIIDKQQHYKKLQKLKNTLWKENNFLGKIPDAEEPPIFWSDEPSHSCSLKTTSQKAGSRAGLTTTQPSSLSCAWKPGWQGNLPSAADETVHWQFTLGWKHVSS